MNQIQPYDPVQLGAIFAQSGMFPDTRNAAQCATKLAVGQGLGLTPYDAMARDERAGRMARGRAKARLQKSPRTEFFLRPAITGQANASTAGLQ